MLRAADLSREQLEAIVNGVQEALYLVDDGNDSCFDPNQDVGGADFIGNVINVFVQNAPDMIPDEEIPCVVAEDGSVTF